MHRRLLSLARDSRLALTVTVVTGLLGGWLIIAQTQLISSTLGRVFLSHATLDQVAAGMRLLLVAIAGRTLLIWINEIAASRIAERVKTDLRNRLLRHILALGPSFTRGERTGELTAASVEGIESLDAYFGGYLPQLIIGIAVPLSILLVVLPLDLLSGLILLLTAPLIPLFMYMIGRGAEAAARRQYGSLGRLSSYFLDSLQGLTTLKAFGQSKAQAQNIARVSDDFRRATLKVMQGSFLSAFALELVATLSTAIIAVEVGLRLLYSQMPFDQALFLLILAPEFYLPLRMLGLRFHAGLAGTAAARPLFQILDTPLPEGAPRAVAMASDAPEPACRWTIELRGVSYSYPGVDRPALQDISLTIPSGRHIALVGSTGAGKSTLASLLLGLVRPTKGAVLLRSEAGDAVDSLSLGSITGWVPQRPHLFHDTIAANIRVGNPRASLDDLTRAARLARLDETVQSLPDKYETIVAEAGSRLSKGEAQRLALARAFLRDAPILILDEATSNLDPENETLLEESTRQLMKGRTVVTIAHRLNTVFQADQIVVLRDGRIVETGTHRELLTQGGEYCRLVDAASETWRPAALEATSEVARESSTTRLPVGEPMPPLLAARGNTRTAASPAGRSSRSSVGTFLRLLNFLRDLWSWVALAVLLAGLTVGSSVALMGTSAWLISTAALHPSIAALDLAIVGVRFFGIARAVFRYLERLVTHSVTLELLRHLRVWFYEKLEPLAPARLMHYAAGDLLARAVDDVNTLENFFVRILQPPLVAIIVTIGVCWYLAAQNLALAAPFLGLSVLVAVLSPAVIQTASRPYADDLVRGRAALEARLVDSIQGLGDIAAFGLQEERLATIRDAGSAYAAAQARLSRLNALHSGLAAGLTSLAMWSLLIVAIPLVTAQRLSGVMLAPLALITLAAFEASSSLPAASQWWGPVRAAADRMFEMVEAQPAVEEPHKVHPHVQFTSGPAGAAGGGLDLRVVDLTFAYPGEDSPALRHIAFHVAAGESFGIVGPSGAGKSTLVNLLMRFWDYSSGEICLGGTSLRACSGDEVRTQISLVSQDTHLFDTTIYENLRMALRGATREAVEQAAREAQIHDFITGLPAGYATLVGEHGLRLSAGERQRLAIARALLKNAPILILDEPTANLDTATERLILETLFQLMKRKTSLLVTHRLVGLANLGQILVLNRGEVAERGSHAELLELGGTYRRLWDLQNRIWATP